MRVAFLLVGLAALGVSACSTAASVVGTAASVTGSAVSTAADVTGDVVSSAAHTIAGSDEKSGR